MDNDLKNSIIKFIESFEQVFDKDWSYTKERLCIADETEEQRNNLLQAGLETIIFISPEGTFINPKVENENEDWGNRCALLEEYRRLKNLLSGGS